MLLSASFEEFHSVKNTKRQENSPKSEMFLYMMGGTFYTAIKVYCVNLDISLIYCSFLNVPSAFRNVHIFLTKYYLMYDLYVISVL